MHLDVIHALAALGQAVIKAEVDQFKRDRFAPSIERFFVGSVLCAHGPISEMELVRRTMTAPERVYEWCRVWQDLGWLEKTEDGWKLASDGADLMEAFTASMLSYLSEDDFAYVLKALNSMPDLRRELRRKSDVPEEKCSLALHLMMGLKRIYWLVDRVQESRGGRVDDREARVFFAFCGAHVGGTGLSVRAIAKEMNLSRPAVDRVIDVMQNPPNKKPWIEQVESTWRFTEEGLRGMEGAASDMVDLLPEGDLDLLESLIHRLRAEKLGRVG